MQSITEQVNLLAERVHEMHETQERLLICVAGAPGSGKSTLASELARRLNQERCSAMIVPMDGFHLDNAVLDARGLRARKGAPETFDADGFLHMIRRMKEAVEVVAPMFDRSRDLSIAGAVVVPALPLQDLLIFFDPHSHSGGPAHPGHLLHSQDDVARQLVNLRQRGGSDVLDHRHLRLQQQQR